MYVKRGKHIGDDGRTKASRAIRDELGGTYSHQTIRTKLKAMGVEVDEAVEFPGGYKAWGEEEAQLAADITDEAWGALELFGKTFHLLEDAQQGPILQMARDLLGKLERGERPPANMRLDV